MAQDHDSRVPSAADVIKAWRKMSGLSQEQLAEKSGLDRTLTGKYERGVSEPTVPQLEKLAHGFGILGAQNLTVARLLLGPKPGPAAETAMASLLEQSGKEGIHRLRMAEDGGKLAREQADTATDALNRTSRGRRKR